MSFFTGERQIANARRAGIATGPATSFVDVLTADYEASRVLDTSIGDENALYDIYDEELDRLSGLRPGIRNELFNPVTGQLPARLTFRQPRERTVEANAQLFNEEVARFGLESPALDEMRSRAARLAARRRSEAEDIRARATEFSGFASFVGTAAGITTDPPILASMALGAPASAGILRTAVIEGIAAGGAEIAIQPLLAESRAQLGMELTFEEAVQNVLFAAGGGAVFGAGIRAFATGAGKAGETFQRFVEQARASIPEVTETIDARVFLERFESLQVSTPYTFGNVRAQAEHIARVDEAILAGRQGRPADIPPTTPVPVRAQLLDTLPVAAIDQALPAPGRAARAAELGTEITAAVRATAKQESAIAAPRERLAMQEVVPTLDELAEFIRNPAKLPKPQRLLSFLKARGGVRDFQGEMRSLGITGRSRPGLVNQGGMTLDDAGLAAMEAGFFRERPTVSELLEAMREDFQGKGVFREIDETDRQLIKDVRQLERSLDQAELDINEIPPGEIGRALGERANELRINEQSGAGVNIDRSEIDFQRLEITQDEIDRAVETEVLRALDEEEIEIDLGDGEVMTGKELLDDLAEDERAMQEFIDCVTGNAG